MDPIQPEYSPATHALWGSLFARQCKLIEGLACPEFNRGLVALELSTATIPRFDQLSRRLTDLSGWTVHAVDGLLPAEDFFARLAARRFPVTWWLRTPEQSDYIVEPDLFHDLMGHLPMLADPSVGDFMQAYGHAVQMLVENGEKVAAEALTRLYWFTVEFGLVGPSAGPKIYGAGLLSSFQESHWCLDEPRVDRAPANLHTMMRQTYAIDCLQPRYFTIPSLSWLWQWSASALMEAARATVGMPLLAIPPLAAVSPEKSSSHG